MPEFAYTARKPTGENINGVITAASKREALAVLREKSLFPIHVEPAKGAVGTWQWHGRIKKDLIASTLMQLADLLNNGVAVLAALDVLAEQSTHPRLREVIESVRNRVADGASLDEAMAAHPEVFDELTVSMVRAGCEGAFLEDALQRTANFMERQQEMRSRLAGAMAYPAFLAVAGTIVTIVLIVFFVPKFAELFTQLEEVNSLPTPTIVLLGLSDFLGRYGLFVLAGLVGVFYFVRNWARSEAGRRKIDSWKIKLPIFGPIFLNTAISRFCRVLGTLLKNGVPLLKALEISSQSAGNKLLAEAIVQSAENISAGDTLSKPLAACGLIPKPIMAMISVAEEANNLETVLVNIADNLDRKVSRQLDLMVRMVEPALLLVMGSVILFVIVALLLPVFEMSSTLG